MEYLEVRKELSKIYKTFYNDNFGEIDYVLGEILNKNYSEIHFCDISKKQFLKAKKIVLKHLKTYMPYQKIFKRAYFYGLSFYVNENVLTPRQDSEILIEQAIKQKFNSVLDLCCGSGCLGLTIKKNRPSALVTLADISKKAIKISKINAKNLGVSAEFVVSDMFKNIHEKFDLIVCNPPYISISDAKKLSVEVKDFDPKIALVGGETGDEFYRILFDNLDKFLTKNGVCLIEIGYNQGYLLDIFKEKYVDCEIFADYNGINRVIKICRKWLKEKKC